MLADLPEWILKNRIEITGALLGVLYIFFSIRQNILTWPAGLLTSAFYIVVFLNSGFYAYMGLQVYYVIISIYGWYFWLKGNKENKDKELSVQKITGRLVMILTTFTVMLYIAILFFLLKFTDSSVPYLDSFITALSIIATWMLARKILENWLIWIIVDALSVGLFIIRDLWPTAFLFLIYTFLAVTGYYEWKKSIIKNG